MRQIIILFSIINLVFAWYLVQMPATLPIGRGNDGAWLYPISSGSNDLTLLARALQAFAFSLFMAMWSRQLAVAAYVVNMLFLWACWLMLALDSSLWAAAQLGFVAPLLAVGVAHISVLYCVIKIFRQPETII